MKYFYIILFLTSIFSVSSIDSISFKYSEIDSAINDVIWCGINREVIFSLTELNSVYKSEDKGFSWHKLNDIFHQKAYNELDSHENEVIYYFIKIGKVSRMIISPVDKSLLIFLGTHGINWVIQDCGRKEIRALNHGRKIQEFMYHPTERKWGLASAFTICEDFVDEPCRVYKELFITKDLGETWEVIGSYVIQFSWYSSI